MKLCPACMALHKANKWYLSPSCDHETNNIAECDAHPRIDNPRLLRTLKTIKYFCEQPVGYTHPSCRIRPMTYEDKSIHRRCLEAVLFDYEKQFIEFLLQNEYIRQFDGHRNPVEATPRLIQMTHVGDEFLDSLKPKA